MLKKGDIQEAIGVPLFQSNKLACCLTDSKFRFVFINEAFKRTSGYTEYDLIGKSIATLLSLKLFKRAVQEFTNFNKR